MGLGWRGIVHSGIAAALLAIGTRVDGSLDKGDSRLGTGEFTDSYTFQGRAGQRVAIRLAPAAAASAAPLTASPTTKPTDGSGK